MKKFFRELFDLVYTRTTNWLKTNKIKFAILAAIVCIAALSAFAYNHRPSFSATYKLTGSDENRIYVLEVVAPPNSQITMNKIAKQKANKQGLALFRILPGELKRGVNKLDFEVRVPIGLRKTYSFNIEKDILPVTMKISIADVMVNSESMKRVSVVTDPLNTVTIEGLSGARHSATGRESFDLRDYEILQTVVNKPKKLPDTLNTSITIRVTDVDGQEKSAISPLVISTLTNLTVAQPEDTDAGLITLNGRAAPGAKIFIAEGSAAAVNLQLLKKSPSAGIGIYTAEPDAVADTSGSFSLPVKLTTVGTHTILVCAGRPGEKISNCAVTVTKLPPMVVLLAEANTVTNHSLLIKGNTTQGASVMVNGQPAAVQGTEFNWQFELPRGVSREFSFSVEAQKPGYRNNTKIITLNRMPVIR